MKDDPPITKLTSGPCLIWCFDCLRFKSNLMKDDGPGLCIWLFFSKTDGFNTASSWLNYAACRVRGQPHWTQTVLSHVMLHNTPFQISALIPAQVLQKQSVLKTTFSLLACAGRNHYTNIWLKIERNNLYLQVKTAQLTLFWDIQKVGKLFTEHSLQFLVATGQSL